MERVLPTEPLSVVAGGHRLDDQRVLLDGGRRVRRAVATLGLIAGGVEHQAAAGHVLVQLAHDRRAPHKHQVARGVVAGVALGAHQRRCAPGGQVVRFGRYPQR